ncbi:MAG TPA: hypothetical protein VK956_13270, partial [Verrucomicrobium sp.]|nr:hypothetical protein [Verrucomicrobium sp.]
MMFPDVPAVSQAPHFEVQFDAQASVLKHDQASCVLELAIPGLSGRLEEIWPAQGAVRTVDGDFVF